MKLHVHIYTSYQKEKKNHSLFFDIYESIYLCFLLILFPRYIYLCFLFKLGENQAISARISNISIRQSQEHICISSSLKCIETNIVILLGLLQQQEQCCRSPGQLQLRMAALSKNKRCFYLACLEIWRQQKMLMFFLHAYILVNLCLPQS